jgi:Zn-finger nucleic acid-binding protein
MQLDADRGAYICPYCNSEWVPQANFEGVRIMGPSQSECPLCRTALSQARLLSYGILYCTRCEGMVLQMDELMPLSEDLRASRDVPSYAGRPPEPKDLDRRIDCPMCGLTMDTHPYGGPGNVDLDTCEPCSIHWLDRGELRRIAIAPDHRYIT